ncbi:uncharacterized protein LOC106173712 [Lingula anatina]|uniref:Uncharacterized protein LOC106173712 n=1 Tax=Lingula anatina TaxID=7574 RepID=A0A2R2MR43_LINAN|nr:uncharacterized protein LOC106173712 [Lingula anatina]|eukprot:XP_023932720.1 uncharacterized protein LOC106173712 [Lingula anatina]
MEGDTEKSVISSLKTRSRASTLSYAKAKAKAKALEVNLEYVKKQTEIKRQRALLDAEFELISAQKDAAAAAAEAAALDTDSDSSNSDLESLFKLPMDKTKTEKYVETVQGQFNTDTHGVTDGMDPHGVTGGMDPHGVTDGMDPHGVTDGMDPQSVTDGKVPHSAADGMDPHGVTHGKDPHGVAVTADSHGAKGEMLHTDTYGVSDFVPRQSRQDVTSDFPAYLRGTPGYFSRGPEVPNAFLPNDPHGTPVFYPRQQDVPYLVQCIPPLPQPEIPVFKGDVLTYSAFMISFETRIESRVASNTDRLYYLYQYTDGEPKELISGCLYMPDGYKRARELLHKEYGNEYKISMAYLNKLLAWPAVRAEDSVGLKGLSVYLVKCHSAMLHLHNLQVLNHAPHMQAIVKKLPMYSQNRWRGIVAKVVRDEKRSVVFSDLVTFIEHESEAVNDPVFGREALKSEGPSVQTTRFPQTKTARTSPMKRTHTSHPPTPRTSAHPPGSSFAVITDQVCPHCQQTHKLNECSAFLEMPLSERKQLLFSKRLCMACLEPNHIAKGCLNKLTCSKCHKKHPTSLHDPDFQRQNAVTKVNVVNTAVNTSNSTSISQSTMIVPVWISHESNPEREQLIYAMLDTQSDISFVLRNTSDSLQLQGTPVKLSLSTMSACNQILDSSKISGLSVRAYDGSERITLPPCYTRDVIPANRDHIPSPGIAHQWPHLQPIADKLIPRGDFEVGLLIGYNCPSALFPREVIPPMNDGPYALRTSLGWSIVGTGLVNYDGDPGFISHRVMIHEVSPEVKSSYQMNEKVIFCKPNRIKEIFVPKHVAQMLELDFNDQRLDTVAPSREDCRFIDILEKGIHVTNDGHYEMPLPFRKENPVLPNDRELAVKRLSTLQSRFTKDPNYAREYAKFMQSLIDNGHAERVTSDVSKCTWYIPHHGVYNKQKLRVVFDCSARYKDTSLNGHLLKGPDMTNSLIGVLLRFRHETVAFTCDIEKMFYQFRVNEEHRDYLRFLWFNDNDFESVPVDYRMCVHLFGATSSPSCASFALKKMASLHEHECGSDVKHFIHRNFYVDDGLKSTATESDAIELLRRSRQLCEKRGIRLHKVISNSNAVIQSVPLGDRAHDCDVIDMNADKYLPEGALGVQWCVEVDQLQFRILLKDRPLTRRGVLSTISSIFDPLGFVAPVVMVGKRILQELCAENLDWDDPIPDNLRSRWEQWRLGLRSLESISLKRCYKPPEFGSVSITEMHHLHDASAGGYGECSYVRLMNERGQIHCCLLMGKSRVAPLKAVSIPRLLPLTT